MQSKPISASRITLSQMMGPQDTNSYGNVHGGIIMKLVDEAGAIAAMRHAQKPVVTVAVDSMTFKEPIRIGDLIIVSAELTYVGRTSMEVRVEVRAEHPIHGSGRITNSAYLVYVALDSDGRPGEVPPLLLETEDEKLRWEAARERQQRRKLTKG
ncbi:MAG: acyl-CoA thioesterase [Anaerolineae bacterium]|jgi:uncharacterized protein (TIGR00369 family)|nr:MAG: acyl-CoA thioesterase [Anaerolineae bacterium]MCL4876089.1 acyl-CoA thioesterase [Anaerolineae bacterium]